MGVGWVLERFEEATVTGCDAIRSVDTDSVFAVRANFNHSARRIPLARAVGVLVLHGLTVTKLEGLQGSARGVMTAKEVGITLGEGVFALLCRGEPFGVEL